MLALKFGMLFRLVFNLKSLFNKFSFIFKKHFKNNKDVHVRGRMHSCLCACFSLSCTGLATTKKLVGN